jgi:hypothetical protein
LSKSAWLRRPPVAPVDGSAMLLLILQPNARLLAHHCFET